MAFLSLAIEPLNFDYNIYKNVATKRDTDVICHDNIAKRSGTIYAVSTTKKLQSIRMIGLLLHSHHLAYGLMVCSMPKAEETIRKLVNSFRCGLLTAGLI